MDKKQFCGLHTTAVGCAHELIYVESGLKGEAGKILQN